MIRKSASGRTLLALEYDRNGNKVRQTDVTGKVTGFEYDRQGQLLRLTDDGQELASYAYNPDGTPRAVTHGPIRQEYAYDLDKNLTGLTVRSGDTLLSQTGYAYDGNGNRIRKQALDGMTLYQYDALNQLQRVDYPAYSEELFYDKAGNRSRRVLDGEEELYQYDPRNRLMAYTKNGATTPFQYDNAGNLLQDDKAKYTYDAFNRTVKVETFDGNVQVNRYDAEGLRHEMEENGRLVRFIFHKGEAVAEQEENGNVIRLIRGSELIARSSDSESARTYYHYASDEMGSTTHIVDENGNVQNRYAYDAWGRIMVREEAVPNRFTYYGQQIDPITQQYYLRARFYNPVLGRFTQEDTYRGDGLNLYAYCANNPVYYIDPSGFYKDAPAEARNSTYTPGTGVVPRYSSLDERIKVTPPETSKNGYWTGERGQSVFISEDIRVKSILEEMGVEGVVYKDGMPDFSKFAIGEVKINNMTNMRESIGGRPGNYEQADAALAEIWSSYGECWTAQDVQKWRTDNLYTWHELNDMETMQLIPSAINHPIFRHLGGVGEYNISRRKGY
ncbi:RHS repeat-associated core domain-containing protein [Intestinimonas butyriciproducens]|uniref:RHS repeat-associated core domain-containing protein n=1 Tax=Intestinimonas butyriciproducens TaxID=1297617 RepID=UPI00195A5D82